MYRVAAGCLMPALVLAGCGGETVPGSTNPAGSVASTTSTSATVMSKTAAGAEFQADVAPANSAVSAFASKAQAWSSSTTDSQAEADAQPLIQAISTLQSKLAQLAQSYPPASADLKAEVTAAASLHGDLLGLSSLNMLNASSWEQTFERDAATLSAASKTVRADLGLPPPTN